MGRFLANLKYHFFDKRTIQRVQEFDVNPNFAKPSKQVVKKVFWSLPFNPGVSKGLQACINEVLSAWALKQFSQSRLVISWHNSFSNLGSILTRVQEVWCAPGGAQG